MNYMAVRGLTTALSPNPGPASLVLTLSPHVHRDAVTLRGPRVAIREKKAAVRPQPLLEAPPTMASLFSIFCAADTPLSPDATAAGAGARLFSRSLSLTEEGDGAAAEAIEEKDDDEAEEDIVNKARSSRRRSSRNSFDYAHNARVKPLQVILIQPRAHASATQPNTRSQTRLRHAHTDLTT